MYFTSLQDGQMVRACEAYYQGHGAVKNPYSYVKVNTSKSHLDRACNNYD